MSAGDVERKRVLLSWSSGKDCAWALHSLRRQPDVELVGLLTSFNETVDRVAMHAVRHALVTAQAAAVGLPLVVVNLPSPCPNSVYEARMADALAQARQRGVTHVAFGDIFLEDVRAYRERQLEGTGIAPLFPLWGLDTMRLSRDMIAAGLRAVITCVDPRKLGAEFAGCSFDDAFLSALPTHVDPCGERGEFHSFCWDGPMFGRAVPVRVGETVEREGFAFADLLPQAGSARTIPPRRLQPRPR